MGAFIIAGIVAFLTLAIAILSELARGMAPAPSMVSSNFFPILFTGMPMAAIIAATHWLPHIGW
jgi:hypothetical protein